MRREAANENVSMQSSFGNVSILSGYPPTIEERPEGVGVPCRPGVPGPVPSEDARPDAGRWRGQLRILASWRFSPSLFGASSSARLSWTSPICGKDNELGVLFLGLASVQRWGEQLCAGLGVRPQTREWTFLSLDFFFFPPNREGG